MIAKTRFYIAAILAVTCLIPATTWAGAGADETSFNVDRLWVICAAALVFLMQAGFKCFEAGMVQEKSTTGVAMKNIIDWVMGSLIFFAIGFGLMFGHSMDGIVGTDLFALDGLEAADGNPLGSAFFMFQLAFCGTALTIVSGAMSERTSFVSYLVGSAVVALLVYPVFGHWVWGNLFFESNEPWLAKLGFRDFAGSTVVHSVGAWIALVGVWSVGPRFGRFGMRGEVTPIRSSSVSASILGIFLLWFGWWGFNGGSTLAMNDQVGPIILNTNLAAAASGFAAFLHSYIFQGKANLNEKFLGGVLGGLVAITACCDVVTPASAVMIGLLAGLVHNYAYDLLLYKFGLDDPVGAIPVHGFCGVFGTLCVAIFGQAELLPHPRLAQFGVQLIGVVVCFVWTTSAASLMYLLLRKSVGLRVSPQEEISGIHIGGQTVAFQVAGLDASPAVGSMGDDGADEELDEEQLRNLMGE